MVSLVALYPAQDASKKEWGIQCGAEGAEDGMNFVETRHCHVSTEGMFPNLHLFQKINKLCYTFRTVYFIIFKDHKIVILAACFVCPFCA